MSRKKILLLLGLAAALTVAGCGKTEETKETQAPANTVDDAASEPGTEAGEPDDQAEPGTEGDAEADFDLETEAETEVNLDPITPSEYLIKNISDYATLSDLEDLQVTQYNYEITDDLVQDEIDVDLTSYAEEIEVDRPSSADDVIYVDMTYSIQGEEDSETTESTYFTVGEEEYGAEFDKEITGVSTGDTLSFSIDFDDEIWMDEWVDQTVDFKLTVTSVCEVKLPEYNDDFVATYTDYSSKDEYEAAIRENLESEYNEGSRYEAVEALFESAEEETVFSGYPEELYDQCKQELLSFYSMLSGTDNEEDIYEMFGMTAEDLEPDIIAAVNRRLLVNAICLEKDLDVTEDEYVAYITEIALNSGYENVSDFEADYSREALVWELFEAKAGDYLYENAEVTEEIGELNEDEDWDDEAIDLGELELEDETEAES